MEKTMRFLSIAALALVGAVMTGCSSEDNFTAQPQQQVADKGNVVTVTATVGLGEQAGTRKLTIDGSKGVKTFADGDQIAVIYENESGMVKETVNIDAADISTDGKSAKITVTMTDPKASGTLKYIYPAAMAGETDVDYTKLNTQDGTLASLASNLDLAVFDGNLTAEAALPASATLENKLAILALTLKNSGSSDITSSITSLSVGDGNNIYTITGKDADGHIYVAIKPTNSATIGVNATAGTTHYYKELANKTYAKDNGYSVTWKMAQGAHLSAIAADFTANHGDVLTGTLARNVKISIADGATVTLKNVHINEDMNWTSGDYVSITCAGDATIILADENTVMTGFTQDYPGIYVPENKTLTINGDGMLDAISYGFGAGIGGGYNIPCGNIVIKGGAIMAMGGSGAAGIGSGVEGSCGNILIEGGKITAMGGGGGAGIGSGNGGSCDNITITSGVTRVSAEKSSDDAENIGKGAHGSCGTVIIDDVVNPTTSSEFPHFYSEVEYDTWMLRHK
jgi:hypothetical protein